jgi:hypothetical protein
VAKGHSASAIGIMKMMPKMKAVHVPAPGADFHQRMLSNKARFRVVLTMD